MKLTGKKRFRTTWRGKLVLQVQCSYTYTYHPSLVCETRYGWRDAKLVDVSTGLTFEGIRYEV